MRNKYLVIFLVSAILGQSFPILAGTDTEEELVYPTSVDLTLTDELQPHYVKSYKTEKSSPFKFKTQQDDIIGRMTASYKTTIKPFYELLLPLSIPGLHLVGPININPEQTIKTKKLRTAQISECNYGTVFMRKLPDHKDCEGCESCRDHEGFIMNSGVAGYIKVLKIRKDDPSKTNSLLIKHEEHNFIQSKEDSKTTDPFMHSKLSIISENTEKEFPGRDQSMAEIKVPIEKALHKVKTFYKFTPKNSDTEGETINGSLELFYRVRLENTDNKMTSQVPILEVLHQPVSQEQEALLTEALGHQDSWQNTAYRLSTRKEGGVTRLISSINLSAVNGLCLESKQQDIAVDQIDDIMLKLVYVCDLHSIKNASCSRLEFELKMENTHSVDGTSSPLASIFPDGWFFWSGCGYVHEEDSELGDHYDVLSDRYVDDKKDNRVVCVQSINMRNSYKIGYQLSGQEQGIWQINTNSKYFYIYVYNTYNSEKKIKLRYYAPFTAKLKSSTNITDEEGETSTTAKKSDNDNIEIIKTGSFYEGTLTIAANSISCIQLANMDKNMPAYCCNNYSFRNTPPSMGATFGSAPTSYEKSGFTFGSTASSTPLSMPIPKKSDTVHDSKASKTSSENDLNEENTYMYSKIPNDLKIMIQKSRSHSE